MKKLMLGTAMAVIFASGATAQDLFRAEIDPVAITASEFIGKRVYAAEATVEAGEYAGVQDGWNDIGEINDVILTRDGRVDAVLVDIGGFLGMGERQVAVGMENIRFVSDSATAEDLNDFFLVMQADRAILEAAPEYLGGAVTPVPAEDTAAVDGDGMAAPAVGNDAEVAATDTAPADGTRMVEGYAAVDPAGVTAEQLIGVRLYGPADEDLGAISDIVLDENGRAAKVIVDVGGFLGIGAKPVAIDMRDMQLMQATDGDTLRGYVPMTQDELKNLPEASI